MKIAINGLGIVGCALVAKAVSIPDLKIVAVNDLRVTREAATDLLKNAPAEFLDDIEWLREPNPRHLPWAEIDVDAVVEASQLFRRDELACQSAGGRIPVIMTGDLRGSKPDVTFVPGVNTLQRPPEHVVVCGGSDRTQSLCPILHVLHQRFGVHQFDAAFHRIPYVGRPWAITRRKRHIKQIARVLPWVKRCGTLTRVDDPMANVGTIWLNAQLKSSPDLDEVTSALQQSQAISEGAILVADDEHRVLGSTYSCIVNTSRIDVRDSRLWMELKYDPLPSYVARTIQILECVNAFSF